MIQLNLLPDVKEKFLKTQRTKRVITFSAISVSGFFIAILVILSLNVYAFQKQHIDNLSGDITDGINTLKNIDDLDKILTIQNQLNALPELHDLSPETSRVFDILSNIVPKDVVVGTVDLGFGIGELATEPLLTINGQGKDFKTINKFVDTLKNAEFDYKNSGFDKNELPRAFESVVLDGIGRDDTTSNSLKASYVVVATYNPEIFNNTSKDLKVTVPNITSSISSVERPSVFKEAK